MALLRLLIPAPASAFLPSDPLEPPPFNMFQISIALSSLLAFPFLYLLPLPLLSLYVCARVRVCIYACMHVCMHVSTYVHTYTRRERAFVPRMQEPLRS